MNRVEHEQRERERVFNARTREPKTFDVSEGADLIETFPGTRLDLQFDRIYQ